MKGINQPYFRKSSRCWYINIDGKQIRLAEDRALSYQIWHEMMAGKRPEKSAGLSLSEIVYKFVESQRHTKSSSTVIWYERQLQYLIEAFGKEADVLSIKPYQLIDYINKKEWKTNSKHNLARAVRRLYRWALVHGVIDSNPFSNIEMPKTESANQCITPQEANQILDSLTDGPFKDLIILAWDTGMRTQELKRIESRHVHDDRTIVLPPNESKANQLRVVFVGTDRAWEIVDKNRKLYPNGPILRNTKEQPWNQNSIKCCFQRLEQKCGIKTNLPAFRKGFCTEALKAGLDTVTVAHLMGHSNAVMVSRVYGKVAQDKSWMAEAARRAKRQSSG